MSRDHLSNETRKWLARIGRRGGANGSQASKVRAGKASAARRARLREIARLEGAKSQPKSGHMNFEK